MEAIKSYTDLEQAKKLAEILPTESADMKWIFSSPHDKHFPLLNDSIFKIGNDPRDLPCWSLTALLNVLPSSTLDSSNDHHYRLHCMERFTEWHDNSIDACVEMMLKLHELKLL